MHFLPGDAEELARVDDFDVEALARQLESVGAGYLILTLGQNSGFFNAPNPTYERITGYVPGERTSRRDLPLDLHRALEPRGIRLMLYLPCQAPNEDRRAQRAFGLPEGPKDQPIDREFARRWAEVIGDWSVRYGDRVAGWWFDGGYEWVGFDEEIAGIYTEAARRGNPRSLVTFNPGIGLRRWTRAESYTAGELTEPFDVLPASRWEDGSQWHALTYLGSRWGARDTRHPSPRWVAWVRAVSAMEGVVTLDMGPNWDPQAGPIGSLASAQREQFVAIREALGDAPRVRIDTAHGPITVELDAARAPVTTRNFLRYVREGFYSNGEFFRTVTADNQPDDAVRIAVIQARASPERESEEHPGDPSRAHPRHRAPAPRRHDLHGPSRPRHRDPLVLHLRRRSTGAGLRGEAEPRRAGLRGLRAGGGGHGGGARHPRLARRGAADRASRPDPARGPAPLIEIASARSGRSAGRCYRLSVVDVL